jgi:hypothetical protein
VPPSAPDSAIARAQAMMAAQLTAALAPNQASDHGRLPNPRLQRTGRRPPLVSAITLRPPPRR